MYRFIYVAALFIVLPMASAEDREDAQGRGWAVDAKMGTLGIGADLSRSIVPRVVNLRAGASFFAHTTDISENGIDYNARLRLGAIPIVLDVFPFKNWFRIGGGVHVNLNEIKLTTPSTGTVTIGDHQYNLQDIGQLEGKVQVNRAAPYFGLGFGNPIKRRGHLGLFADLGILYHGIPSATLTSSRPFPQLQTDIAKEVQQINNDIKDYRIFPVVQFGISYRF